MGITISVQNSEYQILLALRDNRKSRRKYGEVFVEGIESIKQVLTCGLPVTRFIFSKGKQLSDWAKEQLSANRDAVQIEMAPGLYTELSTKDSPSELLVTVQLPKHTLASLPNHENPFFLVLDRPSDKGNLGSMIRSANAFGVQGIILSGHGVDPYDGKVIRSSLGSVFHTPVVTDISFNEIKTWLLAMKRERKALVIGTDSDGSYNLSETTTSLPAVIIMGNEAKGISRSFKEICDQIVSIPMTGNVNSLNLACAGTIFLWEFAKSQIKKE